MAGSAVAAPDAYPSRPIRLISPYAAGGLTDLLARALGKRLSERLGQPVIVENRTGGGGVAGVDSVAKSPADGYTLVLVGQGLASVNASLYKSLPYDTQRDFAPISMVASFPLVLVGRPGTQPDTLSAFIAAARAMPGAIAYGSAGNASTAHLTMELLAEQAGIKVNHIPYRGEAPAFVDVIAGNTQVMFATLGGARPLLESGRLHPIAIATKERNKMLPNVPTISEAGVPGFEVLGWYGVLAPKATPKPVLDRLSAEFMAMAREPEVREQFLERGLILAGTSSDELGKLIQSETERWRQVVLKAGIRGD
jgi:tripartite-type tricarboxylate transporter receptor subunit TctC